MVTFTTEEITERIIRIKDGTDVCMYLLVGSERALLIDTGYGIGACEDMLSPCLVVNRTTWCARTAMSTMPLGLRHLAPCT